MKSIHLYDYQEEMVGRIREAFKRHRSVMVQMPTGTGKTVVLARCLTPSPYPVERGVNGLVGENEVVWIVAHRRELVEQIEDTVSLFSTEYTENTEAACIKVYSIQWLSRHLDEMTEEPSLIVIDEAHHTLAKTYKVLWERFPKAKFLGLTATPYRLNGKGFTDLFDVLVCSHSVPEFIQMGRLSPFDYVSIRPDSEAQVLIDSLRKRGADGDYQAKEMDEVLNRRPSIERLYESVAQYVKGKKGIVYAISIAHAEHIAEYYCQHGVNAVAISSKTPSSLRKELIERFKNPSGFSLQETSSNPFDDSSKPYPSSLAVKGGAASGLIPNSHKAEKQASEHLSINCLSLPITPANSLEQIDVIVNVDLFGEGFDCPDVEFIQLARPTLSLAKYLQMVGRGLRVHKDKECCTIIDNVGLYKRFGLPTQRWDWQGMFEGKQLLPQLLPRREGSEMLKGNNPLATINAIYKGDYSPLSGRGAEGEASEPLYVVVTRDTLLEALGGMSDNEQRERYKEELLSGKYGKVKSVGADLVECVTQEKQRFFVDLRNMNRMEAKRGTAIPTRLNMSGYEMVRYGQTLYSRTRIVQAIPYSKPDPKRFVRGKFFLAFDLQKAMPYPPILPSRYRKYDMTATEVCCFINGDDREVYRLTVALYTYSLHDSECIIVRDCKGAYWLKTEWGWWKEVCRAGRSERDTTLALVKAMEEAMWERTIRDYRHRCRKMSIPCKPLMQDDFQPYTQNGRWGVRSKRLGIETYAIYKEIIAAPFDYYLVRTTNDLWGILYGTSVILKPEYKKIEILGRQWVMAQTRDGEWKEVQLAKWL